MEGSLLRTLIFVSFIAFQCLFLHALYLTWFSSPTTPSSTAAFLSGTTKTNEMDESSRQVELRDIVMYGTPTLGPPNGSLFTLESIPNEPYDTVFNETFANMVNNYNHPELCPFTQYHANTYRFMRKALQIWDEIAEVEGIPYMLTYGSLLGYVRDKNFTPYDADMDLYVPSWAYERLIKYSTLLPVPPAAPDKGLLYLNPMFRFASTENQIGYTCAGKKADRPAGFCWLVGNIARLAYNYRYLDMFALDHFPQAAITVITKGHPIIVNTDLVLPPRRCTFMGVSVLCPNQPQRFLRAVYGATTQSLRPSLACFDGKFRDATTAPEAHAALLEEWKERVGPAANETENVSGLYVKVKHSQEMCSLLGEEGVAFGPCRG